MNTKSSPTQVLVPRRVERLSAEEFVTVVDRHRVNIARSRFVPPKIGGRGFGQFEVEYKVPVLKPVA